MKEDATHKGSINRGLSAMVLRSHFAPHWLKQLFCVAQPYLNTMTQISKRNLPLSVRLARNKEIATWWLFAAVALSGFSFLGFKFGERIGDNLSNRGETDNTIPTTFLPPISIPSSFIYSPFGFDKNEDAHTALRNDTGIVGKSFNQHTPAIREVRKITWKEDDSIVTPNVS